MNEQEKQPKTWGTYVARVLIVLFFAGVLFMLSTPLISKYNQTHYTMRSCTIDHANYYEQRTVATSKNLAIHTTDCGTLEYNARVSGEELQSLETKINDYRGQQLDFGFGKFQFWSGPKMVYTVGGIE
ncbi:hypothetical protein [Rothia terrae]|uniref:Uncharacterized protein n=1 Tax=Rothia terrae TaxID=396015 RepID=A0A7S7B0A8_9MICC|nr:hypothetical protein [Rothia terrae]QOW64671.1 hypothetical protein IDM49_11665 [Rothia terrae]QOW64736.1 hypothetical protein IDM49_11860 [Rothia terrae]